MEPSVSSPATPYPETANLTAGSRDLLRSAALFVRDSALLGRARLSASARLTIWKDFLKLSLLSSKAKGELELAGFRVCYFDQPTLLFLFREIFVRQTYWFATEAPQPVVLDCGAILGMATLFFKFILPAARIQSFEPDPATFGLLRQNVITNGLQDVTTHNLALWNEDSEVPFYSNAQAPGNLLMSTNSSRSTGEQVVVPARRLSTFIDTTIDLLKLDIEGAELRVIDELAASGKIDGIRQIIIEYHHKIPGEPSSMSRILRILESRGFEYQISASGFPLAQPERFQDVMIYAYQR